MQQIPPLANGKAPGIITGYYPYYPIYTAAVKPAALALVPVVITLIGDNLAVVESI